MQSNGVGISLSVSSTSTIATRGSLGEESTTSTAGALSTNSPMRKQRYDSDYPNRVEDENRLLANNICALLKAWGFLDEWSFVERGKAGCDLHLIWINGRKNRMELKAWLEAWRRYLSRELKRKKATMLLGTSIALANHEAESDGVTDILVPSPLITGSCTPKARDGMLRHVALKIARSRGYDLDPIYIDTNDTVERLVREEVLAAEEALEGVDRWLEWLYGDGF